MHGQVTAVTVVYEAPLALRATTTGAGSTLAGAGRLVTVLRPSSFSFCRCTGR